MRRWMNILYPRRCAVCDRVVSEQEFPVCRGCRKEIRVIRGARCMRCSKKIAQEEQEFCLDCRMRAHAYEEGFAAFVYQGEMKESLMKFKYGGRQEYGVFYGMVLAREAEAFVQRVKPEVLIPVPVHRSKLLKRGYNQAEVLAIELSKRWGIPMNTTCMIRKKHTKAQKNLSPADRKKNLTDAFTIVEKVPWKRVMIVDDIYTTGSTIDTIAALLKRSGVENVYFVTVCIGTGES